MKKLAFATVVAIAAASSCAAQNQPSTPIEPVMVAIPGGQFVMGSANAAPFQPGAPSDGPAHTVTLKPFKLAKYELTVKQFRQFVEATRYAPTGADLQDKCWKWAKPGDGGFAGVPMALPAGRWDTPAYAPGDYHPVMCVSWNDAQAYVQWLSASTGKKYRLPSESEWEYAARAGATGKFASGETADGMCRHGNVWDKSGRRGFLRELGWDRNDGDCDDMAEFTSVVGMYEGNAFGLHDMFGNVTEFVQDCQHNSYAGAPGDGTAWVDACDATDDGGMVMTRGASYGVRGNGLRFAARTHSGRTNRSSMGEGIRIAQTIDADQDVRATPNPFEAELAKAQAAERARRASLARAGVAPVVTANANHARMLDSRDQQAAANKRLVYDFWREVFEAGRLELADKYLTETYIQHNPNVPTGRAGFVEFFGKVSKPKSVAERVKAPLVAITAEGDIVVMSFVQERADPRDASKKYTTTWFDMFRIENGKIAEHWDGDVKQ